MKTLRKILTYRISTLPSKHRTPDHLHGLLSMGSQSWKAPWGSASTLAFSSSNASPTTQTAIDSHKSKNTVIRQTQSSTMPSIQNKNCNLVTFTIDRRSAPASLCLEQDEEEKQQQEPRAAAMPLLPTHGSGSAFSREIAARKTGASSLPTVAG